jgi:DNA sulfur modification protein DndC
MQGYLQGSYKQLHHGPYKKEIREEWLKELLEIQKDINENGPEEFADLELITLPELRHIRRIWVNDKHEFDDTLPRIYKAVMEKEFDDPEWLSLESFKAEEWEILKSVVEELYPDEELAFEMAYSLIDIENQSNSLNQRKGVADALESCIQRTFYKDEKDATEYYLSQIARKKDLGGKYNEKALDNTYDEPTEDEESDEDEDFSK